MNLDFSIKKLGERKFSQTFKEMKEWSISPFPIFTSLEVILNEESGLVSAYLCFSGQDLFSFTKTINPKNHADWSTFFHKMADGYQKHYAMIDHQDHEIEFYI